MTFLARTGLAAAEDRRHYPQEHDGAKNEWKALVNHYDESERQSVGIEAKYHHTKNELQKKS